MESEQDVSVISDPRTLSVVYDPLRFKMLRHLAEPRTIKELAGALHTTTVSLYYHVHLLEDVDAISIVGKVRRGKKPENLYQSNLANFRVAPELQEAVVASPMGMVSGTLNDIVASLVSGWDPRADKDTPSLILNLRRQLPQKRALEFYERSKALVLEYFGTQRGVPDDDGEEEPGSEFGCLVVLAPLANTVHPQNPPALRALREES